MNVWKIQDEVNSCQKQDWMVAMGAGYSEIIVKGKSILPCAFVDVYSLIQNIITAIKCQGMSPGTRHHSTNRPSSYDSTA